MSPRTKSSTKHSKKRNSVTNIKKKLNTKTVPVVKEVTQSTNESIETITRFDGKDVSISTDEFQNNIEIPKSISLDNNNDDSLYNIDDSNITEMLNDSTYTVNQMDVDKDSISDEVYQILTTYKTEIVEKSVDPVTGDIIEVITEIIMVDSIDLNKIHETESKVDNLEEVYRQLTIGTEICKELLK